MHSGSTGNQRTRALLGPAFLFCVVQSSSLVLLEE